LPLLDMGFTSGVHYQLGLSDDRAELSLRGFDRGLPHHRRSASMERDTPGNDALGRQPDDPYADKSGKQRVEDLLN
jgi:hypothetical protein